MKGKVRVLVIRFSSIGDVVLTTPVLRHLEEQLDGEVEIHYLTKKSMAPLLENNPRIHTLHTIEKTTSEVMPVLKEIPIDYVIDLHNNARSGFVKRGLKMLDFTLNKRNWQKWVLVNFGMNKLPPGEHIVDRYLDTLNAFNFQKDHKGLEYYLPEAIDVKGIPSEPYMVFVLGATHEGKLIATKQWYTLAENTGKHPIVLIGGKEETDIAIAIKEKYPEMIDFTGKTSLNESAYIIQQSACVISGDTGFMHIASAFNKPILSIWGCTSPALQMSPYLPNENNLILEPIGLSKRPCSKLGNRCKYGKGETRCITRITPEQLQQSITLLRERVFSVL
ncbi:MAG: glycosyltransferase family 9 protein [Bacteroidota bacterium]